MMERRMADVEAPATPTPTTGQTSGSEAAAILLMLLGDNEAADVLSRLDPSEVQHLGAAMFNVADVSEAQVENVFDIFLSRARRRTTIGFGAGRRTTSAFAPAPRIRSVMEQPLGPERAESVLARITPPTDSRALDALRWM